MNRSTMFLYAGILTFSLLFSIGGCQKKIVKVPETLLEKAKEPISTVGIADTSDSVSFNEAKLQGELLRLTQEALKPVYFDFDKSTIRQESKDRLAIIGKFMMDQSSVRVLITGNCDERGTSDYNIGLGETRARVSKDFLAAYGIAANRLETTSYGRERPAVNGCTDDSCHAKNRRDEFSVLSGTNPVSSNTP